MYMYVLVQITTWLKKRLVTDVSEDKEKKEV